MGKHSIRTIKVPLAPELFEETFSQRLTAMTSHSACPTERYLTEAHRFAGGSPLLLIHSSVHCCVRLKSLASKRRGVPMMVKTVGWLRAGMQWPTRVARLGTARGPWQGDGAALEALLYLRRASEVLDSCGTPARIRSRLDGAIRDLEANVRRAER